MNDTIKPSGNVARSTVFKTNRTQAVRLPKAVAFPEGVREVEITVVGASRLITPVGKTWDEWFRHGPRLSEDFETPADLPPEEREPF